MNRVFCTLTLLASLVAMAGCDDGRPARYPASGQVLIDGPTDEA